MMTKTTRANSYKLCLTLETTLIWSEMKTDQNFIIASVVSNLLSFLLYHPSNLPYRG